MVHLCHCEPILMVFVLDITGRIEMDLCDAYLIQNHDTHHYCKRKGVGQAPFGALRVVAYSGSSNYQIVHAKVFSSQQREQ
jgi:hypothetical protein